MFIINLNILNSLSVIRLHCCPRDPSWGAASRDFGSTGRLALNQHSLVRIYYQYNIGITTHIDLYNRR
jgi:hypothetical protein